MFRKILSSSSFLLAGIFVVGFYPGDSSKTTISFSGNLGQYAEIQRGCSGNIIKKDKIPIQEADISINRKPVPYFRLGLNGILVNSKRESYYLNDRYETIPEFHSYSISLVHPNANLETKYFGLGIGYFWSTDYLPELDWQNSLTGYLRIGNPRSAFFDISVLHTMPLSSGYFQVGFGKINDPRPNWWVGLGLTPYDALGLSIKLQTHLKDRFYLDSNTRIGVSEGIFEGTLGFGITYKIPDN